MNNPLSYNDPSGETWGELGLAVVIGVVIAAATYTATAFFSAAPFTGAGILKAMAIGAVSAAVTYGIGSACENLFAGSFYIRAGAEALAHGAFQGGLSSATGGNFWSGFAAGAISSLAASAWSGGDSITDNGDYTMSRTVHTGIGQAVGANTTTGTIAFGSVMGGAGAALSGGNFWVGAATGLVVSGLNHTMHEMKNKQEDPAKQQAREIVKKYGRGNVKEITNWLHRHPIITTEDGVQFQGISDVTGLAPQVAVNRASEIGGMAFDEILSWAADKVVKGSGNIFNNGKLSEPITTESQLFRKIDAINNLIQKMFMPQGSFQTPSMSNNYSPYSGPSRYEQIYRLK